MSKKKALYATFYFIFMAFTIAFFVILFMYGPYFKRIDNIKNGDYVLVDKGDNSSEVTDPEVPTDSSSDSDSSGSSETGDPTDSSSDSDSSDSSETGDPNANLDDDPLGSITLSTNLGYVIKIG